MNLGEEQHLDELIGKQEGTSWVFLGLRRQVFMLLASMRKGTPALRSKDLVILMPVALAHLELFRLPYQDGKEGFYCMGFFSTFLWRFFQHSLVTFLYSKNRRLIGQLVAHIILNLASYNSQKTFSES